MTVDRGTVVLVELDPTVGHEQRGLRPCVAVSDPSVNADQRFPLIAVVPVTGTAGVVCTVLTADCLPIFLCDRRSTRIGVLHAGWRGLAAGIVEEGLRKIHLPTANLLAWLGPAIGPSAYEVSDEVRQTFIRLDRELEESFTPVHNRKGHWLADLYDIARRRLRAQGVHAVYGGLRCTLRERNLFFSHRRDGNCGRMASLIWLDKNAR